MSLDECIGRMRASISEFDTQSSEFSVGNLDPEIQEEIGQLFDDSFRQLLDRLGMACNTRDYGLIEDSAHQIKGMAGTVGYPEISVVAKEMEEAAKLMQAERCQEMLQLLSEWNNARARAN